MTLDPWIMWALGGHGAIEAPPPEECAQALEAIETMLRRPELPAEVHNPTKIDPEAAMAAVRSLCG